jgi:hypothetical protein
MPNPLICLSSSDFNTLTTGATPTIQNIYKAPVTTTVTNGSSTSANAAKLADLNAQLIQLQAEQKELPGGPIGPVIAEIQAQIAALNMSNVNTVAAAPFDCAAAQQGYKFSFTGPTGSGQTGCYVSNDMDTLLPYAVSTINSPDYLASSCDYIGTMSGTWSKDWSNVLDIYMQVNNITPSSLPKGETYINFLDNIKNKNINANLNLLNVISDMQKSLSIATSAEKQMLSERQKEYQSITNNKGIDERTLFQKITFSNYIFDEKGQFSSTLLYGSILVIIITIIIYFVRYAFLSTD